MTDVVIDTSAAIDIARAAITVKLTNATLYAPEIIDLEFVNILRKLLARRLLAPENADQYLDAWVTNSVVRCSPRLLLPRIWQLRDNFTSYDASFVALAEHLAVPLLTTDHRLAEAARRHCDLVTLTGDPRRD